LGLKSLSRELKRSELATGFSKTLHCWSKKQWLLAEGNLPH